MKKKKKKASGCKGTAPSPALEASFANAAFRLRLRTQRKSLRPNTHEGGQDGRVTAPQFQNFLLQITACKWIPRVSGGAGTPLPVSAVGVRPERARSSVVPMAKEHKALLLTSRRHRLTLTTHNTELAMLKLLDAPDRCGVSWLTSGKLHPPQFPHLSNG
jgi:hypothetical protein